MMTEKTKKGLYVVGGILALAGAYYFFIYRPKNTVTKNETTEDVSALGKSAVMLVDGWVYDMNKVKSYQKKKSEWVGTDLQSFDKDFWQLKNSKNRDILAKKTEVKTI
jgi:hypothetical protein